MQPIVILLLTALAIVPARAATLYSTLGPGNTFSSLKYGTDGPNFIAFQFQVNTAATLSSITVVLAHEAPGGQTQFELRNGTPTALGTVIETLMVTAPSPASQLVTMNSSLQPLLTPGNTYWLLMQEPGATDGSRSQWSMNNQSVHALYLTNTGNNVDSWSGAFQLDGSPVPEPAAAGFVLCGLLAIGAAKIRNRAN